jgi:CRP-like cAMP-binding protein
MQTIEHLLAEHPFCAGLAPGTVALLAGCAWNMHFAMGEYVLREGEEAGELYLLREGTVSLETHAPPRGVITIETIDAGEALGWSWLFPPYRWHFSARALEPVRAITLDGVCLRGKCEADPALGYELMARVAQVMLERLQATQLRLLDMYGDVNHPTAKAGGLHLPREG